MKNSYVIITRNRRDVLLKTLDRLARNSGLDAREWEVVIVDNASDDGSPEAAAAHPLRPTVIRLYQNEGMSARNHALPIARGEYITFLDDDSYPLPLMMARALEYMQTQPRTAALVARVFLPNGQPEAPAFPTVTLGGASIVRARVLKQVGGFPVEFFRQAEEYDLSFRIWQAGFRIERYEDICFGHDKAASGRSSALTRQMDLRNNLIIAERYLPPPLRREYRRDWLRRYAALARADGHGDVIAPAIADARRWANRDRPGRRPLCVESVEQVFGLDAQAQAVTTWSRTNRIRRVAIADFGKNTYATWRACRIAGLSVEALIDASPAFAGQTYRGAPIIADANLPDAVQGIVLSTINPAQIESRLKQLSAAFSGPILRLWHPRRLSDIRPQTLAA